MVIPVSVPWSVSTAFLPEMENQALRRHNVPSSDGLQPAQIKNGRTSDPVLQVLVFRTNSTFYLLKDGSMAVGVGHAHIQSSEGICWRETLAALALYFT